jgi:hypothetical protein
MFLKPRDISLLFFLAFSQYWYCQKTNVILPSLMDKYDLKTTVLNNGVKLNVIYQSEFEFDVTEWKSKTNKPTVLITNSGDYLYNSKSLSGVINPCSLGKHPAKSKDFENLNKLSENYNSILIGLNLTSKIPFLEYIPSCDSYNNFTISNGNIYVTGDSVYFLREWSDSRKTMDSTRHFNFYDVKNMYHIPQSLLSAAPLRCVYNSYSDYFQLNQNKYKELCPSSFLELTQSIRSNVQFETKLNASVKIQLLFSFNEKGELSQRILYSDGKNVFNEEIGQSMNKTLRFPYFDDLKIHTSDTLEFEIIPNTKSRLKAELDLSKTSQQFRNHIKDSYLMAYLGTCKNMDAKALYKLPNNIITFTDSYYNETSSLHLKKVICPGPINALYSVIPGLGIYQFKQTGWSHRKLLGTSLPVAAIAIASKLISINYYNRFKSNLTGLDATRNYQLANTTQKIFVASSALYAGLALVDFTWTFSLGVKSKHYQHQANKELRLMHKQNLWL